MVAFVRRLVLLTLVWGCVHGAVGTFDRLLEPWELEAQDALLRWRHAAGRGPTVDPRLAYVELRDEDLVSLETPYFGRGDYARLVRALSACDVALQVHDVVFAAPSGSPHDRELVNAVRQDGHVVLGHLAALAPGKPRTDAPPWKVRVEGSASTFPAMTARMPAFTALNAAAAAQGFLDVTEDRDGVLRRIPVLTRAPGGFRPSLPLAAVCRLLGIGPERIRVVPGDVVVLEGARDGADIEIPIDERGYARIDYPGLWADGDHYAVSDVLRGAEDVDDIEIWRDRLRGRVVLVADITTGSGDLGTTPLEASYPKRGLQLAMLNGLLGGGFLREERHGVSLVIEIIALLLLAWLAGRPATLTFLLGAALLHAAVLGSVGLVLVEAKLVLPVLRPLLVLSVATLLLWARRHVDAERRKAQLQGVFASYFPPALVERFVRDPSRLALDGRRAELTVLFSDIVDFTPMTADMDPGDVHLILNEYFEAMAEEVFEQDGTLDKFIGDGLMVFFGDPTPHEDHAARAVRAALGMQRRVARLNQHWEAEGRKTIRIRIGIHTGPVVVGNMGSSRRLSYTVLGAAVNLAARMESGAPAGGVLITGVTRERIGDEFTCEAVVPVVAKGFPDPIPAYVVRDAC